MEQRGVVAHRLPVFSSIFQPLPVGRERPEEIVKSVKPVKIDKSRVNKRKEEPVSGY